MSTAAVTWYIDEAFANGLFANMAANVKTRNNTEIAAMLFLTKNRNLM
jgi:hypothetical protein